LLWFVRIASAGVGSDGLKQPEDKDQPKSAAQAAQYSLHLSQTTCVRVVAGLLLATICEAPNIDRLAKEDCCSIPLLVRAKCADPSAEVVMYSRYRGRGTVTLVSILKNNGYLQCPIGKNFHMRVPR